MAEFNGCGVAAVLTADTIGTEDDKLEEILEVVKAHCSKRIEHIPQSILHGAHTQMTEVLVGGATVFVSDVIKFEKY